MKPAARLGDMHTCPMVNGTVPHVGGPILPPCAVTVTIGGMPAARVGDLATCVGPPDTISMGSMGVFIEGKPAARLGDRTVHGGVIVVGCPTVLVGEICGGAASLQGLTMSAARAAGAPFTKASCDGGALRAGQSLGRTPTPPQLLAEGQRTGTGARRQAAKGRSSLRKGMRGLSAKPRKTPDPAGFRWATRNFVIDGDEAYQAKVKDDLRKIYATPTGKGLLKSIGKSDELVVIQPLIDPGSGNAMFPIGSFAAPTASGKPARGRSSVVLYDPDNWTAGDGALKWQTRPPAIGLAHELIHAEHAATGTMAPKKVMVQNDSKPDPKNVGDFLTAPRREVETVGIPPHDERRYTENKIRNEWDPRQPQRPWY